MIVSLILGGAARVGAVADALSARAAWATSASDIQYTSARAPRQLPSGEMSRLIYELLDTITLATGLACDPEWSAHLEYLTGLQRIGREALAQMTVDAPA